MKKIALGNLTYLFGGAIAFLAIVITTISMNSACLYVMHQPEVPESAKKLRKF